jgi:hypothetical protein
MVAICCVIRDVRCTCKLTTMVQNGEMLDSIQNGEVICQAKDNIL